MTKKLTFAEENELEEQAVEESSERIESLGKKIAEALAGVRGARDWEKIEALTKPLLGFAINFEGDPLMTAKQKLARHFIDQSKYSYPCDEPKRIVD